MSLMIPPWLRPSKAPTTPAVPIGYWVAVAVAALPVVAGTTWAVFGQAALAVLAVVAIGLGAVWHAPTRRWPWVAVAVSVGAATFADRVWPVLWLAAFLALAVGLLRLRRLSGDGPTTAAVLDTLAVTLLLILLTTVIGAAAPWSPDKAYTLMLIGDLLLVAAAVRLVVIGPLNPAVCSLVGATLAALAGDAVAGLAAAGVTVALAPVDQLAGVLAIACLGFAALHPSMAGLTEPEPAPTRALTLRHLRHLGRRLAPPQRGGLGAVVALTALVAPVVLLVEAVTGEVRDGVVLAVVGGALTLVALARLATVGTSHARSLVFQASMDTLTGLASRSHLMRHLTERVDPPWSAVLLIDIDEFRQVNEDAGPSLGDAVLITLAARLQRLAGPDDIVARFGGDEFAILVAGPRDLTALTRAAVAATTEPVMVGGRTVGLSACIGVAVPPGSTDDPAGRGGDVVPAGSLRADAGGEEMVRRAGMALRAAKAAGPGEWCRYDSDRHALLIERLRLREALTRAVNEDAFRLEYQPIVALATGETVGFEALVRWAHPSRGLVGPAEFIAVAEETGLIEAIGDLVLRTALAEAVGWPRTDVYISVNVSPRQLRRPGFAERVDEVLSAAGLPANRLMLELTESALTGGSDHVWGELAVLRDRGVRLAIDDFGTGFSSLSYLEQTPIGTIKMDKSFVDSLVVSERQRTVVDGIVSMANRLGLQVVAEGIESPAERDLLVGMNCRYGQGYLYSAPLTSTEVIGWLAHPMPQPAAELPAPRSTPESIRQPDPTAETSTYVDAAPRPLPPAGPGDPPSSASLTGTM